MADGQRVVSPLCDRLERGGPMLGNSTCAKVPWPANGWSGSRSIGRLLQFLCGRSIATVGREGRERRWDLAGRWYGDVEALPAGEADAYFEEQRFRSQGVLLRKGKWLVHPDADPRPVRGTTLLSPFDRLIHDRARTEALWDFYYRIEIYVPKAERKYGYFVLPVLHNAAAVGRIDRR
jgi:uncharacterized protein YcaQ